MNLNYSIPKIFDLLIDSFHYPIMAVIILSSCILFAILMLNQGISRYIICFISLILIIMIIGYYYKHLISVDAFKYIGHNMYFYFLNSIIYLIIISVSYFKMVKKLILNIFYAVSFIFICFALFMTHYMNNNNLLTLGNIYHIVVMGNYLYFIFYIYILVNLFLTKKRRVCYNLSIQEVITDENK